jgi:hypothetical protein
MEISAVATNYQPIIRDNLAAVYQDLVPDLAARLGARQDGDRFSFPAFGEDCTLTPGGVLLSGEPSWDPRALLVSLYARHAGADPVQLEPFKAFKDLPDSMPYSGAFSANSERILVPVVRAVRDRQETILERLNGRKVSWTAGGDFSFVLHPLPKIALGYIFYLPDEEFPASVTCLFSANSLSFMPLDGLADVAEYTSKEIMQIVRGAGGSQ